MKSYAPLQEVEPVLSILSRISFFGGITDSQRDEIFGRMETGHFAAGEYITRRGEEPSHIYIINRGRVELRLDDGAGEITKREFKVGDCFGEAALLSLINHTASFVAAEDCELVVLSRRALNRLRAEDPALFSVLIMNLARELARKLQYSDDLLLRLEHAHAS